MASQQFSLEAIISAQTTQMESALSRLSGAINETSTALESKLATASQRASASLSKIRDDATSSGSGISDAFGKMRETALHFVEVLGAIEGVRWAKEQVGQALDAGEALKNLSLQTGISTAHIQELQFAATATGASTDRLVMFTQRLTRAYVQLQTSSSQSGLAAVLQSSGLKAADLQNSYTAITKISEAINRMGVSSARSRELLTELGGRSAAQLAPAIARFQELAQQAEKMGLVLNGSTIDALEHAQEQFNVLGFVINVDKERLAAALAPALQVVATALTDVAEKVNQLAQGGGMQRFAVAAANETINLSESILTATQDLIQFGETLAHVAAELENFKTEASDAIHAVFAPITALADAGEAVGGVIGASISAGIHGHLPTGADLAATVKTAFGASTASAGSSDMFAAERKQLEALRAEIDKSATSMSEVSGVDTGATAGGGAAPLASPRSGQEAARQHEQALQQQLQSFTEEQALEVAVAGDSAQAKVAADQKVYEKAVALFGQQSKQAERAAVAELNARRQEVAQTEQLYAAEIAQRESLQQAQFSVEKTQLTQAVALHKISQQQELQGEIALAGQEEAARQAAFDKLATLYQNDQKRYQAVLAQKAKAELQYQQQVIQLQTQLATTEEKQQTATANKLQSVFQTAFQSLNSAGKGWLSVGESIFQKMLSQFEDMTAKMLSDWISNSAAMKGVEAGFGAAMNWGEGLLGFGAASAPGSPAPGGPPAALGAAGAGVSTAAGAGAGVSTALGAAGAGVSTALGAAGALQSAASMAEQLTQATVQTTLLTTINASILAQSGLLTAINAQLVVMATALSTLNVTMDTILTVDTTAALKPSVLGTTYAGGGIVPYAARGMVARGHGESIPAILHAREMVLPAHISDGIQESLNWGRGLGGGAGSPNVHINFGDTHALDSDGMYEVLQHHGERIANTVADHFGRMGGRFAR